MKFAVGPLLSVHQDFQKADLTGLSQGSMTGDSYETAIINYIKSIADIKRHSFCKCK